MAKTVHKLVEELDKMIAAYGNQRISGLWLKREDINTLMRNGYLKIYYGNTRIKETPRND